MDLSTDELHHIVVELPWRLLRSIASSNWSLSAPENLIALLEYLPHLLFTSRRGLSPPISIPWHGKVLLVKLIQVPREIQQICPASAKLHANSTNIQEFHERSRRSRLSSPGELPFTAASLPCFQLQRTLGTCGRQISSIAPTALLFSAFIIVYFFRRSHESPQKRWPPQ